MELFTNQVLAGIATGAIYACMALAVVMIYQAIDHLNFAQGEMAMFSTFISWQLMQWGVPYWGAFVLTLVILLRRRHRHRAAAVQAAGQGADPDQRRRLHRAVRDHQQRRRPDLGLHHQAVSDAVRILALPRQPADLDPPGRHDRRHAAAADRCCIFFFQFTRIGLAMRAAASLPESARLVGINTSWMIALGWGMAAAIGSIAGMLIAPVVFLEPNMMVGVLIYGFAAAVLGGLTSPLGAVIGGFLVGIFENLAGTYIPGVGNELKLPIALALIITVLVVKPAGPVWPAHREASLIMSAVEEVVTEAPAVEAVPKRAMTLGLGTSLVVLAAADHRAAVRQELHHLPDDDAADLRACRAGAEHPDRRQRPVLARPERVLRGRRLYVGDPDGTCRHELRADAADRRRHLLRLRLPVRPAGAAALPASIWRWRPSRSRSRCRSC